MMVLTEALQDNRAAVFLLPIGSIVRLKDSKKRVMIIGYCQMIPGQPDVIYDYCGCLYPEGYQDADHLYLFHHSQIEEIYEASLEDDELQLFCAKLLEVYRSLRKH